MDTFTIILFIILAMILLIFGYFYRTSLLGLFGYSTNSKNNTNTNNKINNTNTNNINNNNNNTKIKHMSTNLSTKNKEINKKKITDATIDNISQFSLPSFNEKHDNLSFLDDTISKKSNSSSLPT